MSEQPNDPGDEGAKARFADEMSYGDYLHLERYRTLYELGEKLVDMENYFRRWRCNHVTPVERIIGCKRGTSGTSGVKCLREMLDVELFPELWHLRGEL